MTDRPPRRCSSALFWAAALLWLPVGVVASAAVRFGSDGALGEWVTAIAMGASSLIVAAVCSLPLALTCRRLGRLGHPRLAWIGGAVLGVATVAASLPAGLFGPPGIAVVAVLLSLPVWISTFWLARQAREGAETGHPPLDGQDPRP